MSRIVIASHAPSNTINALAVLMNNRPGEHTTLRMRRTGSRFVGRDGDLLVNYGSRNPDLVTRHKGQGRILNQPDAVAKSSDKVAAFQAMVEAGVSCVESTTDLSVAHNWLSNGEYVFVRNTVSGHSGEGIEVFGLSQPESADPEAITVSSGNLPSAPLYTKGMWLGRQHREFRIHVMKDAVPFVQQKKRLEEWREIPEYSNIIRNYHTGWVYANSEAHTIVNRAAIYHAVKAVEALGLDFGAVDVITRGEDAYVLEVNTAPGMTGSNLETFATNLLKVYEGQTVSSIVTIPNTDPRVDSPEEDVSPEPIPEPVVITGMDKRFVKVVYDNSVTVGFYNLESDTYTLAGIDIAVDATDVVVLEVLA